MLIPGTRIESKALDIDRKLTVGTDLLRAYKTTDDGEWLAMFDITAGWCVYNNGTNDKSSLFLAQPTTKTLAELDEAEGFEIFGHMYEIESRDRPDEPWNLVWQFRLQPTGEIMSEAAVAVGLIPGTKIESKALDIDRRLTVGTNLLRAYKTSTDGQWSALFDITSGWCIYNNGTNDKSSLFIAQPKTKTIAELDEAEGFEIFEKMYEIESRDRPDEPWNLVWQFRLQPTDEVATGITVVEVPDPAPVTGFPYTLPLILE